MVILLIIMILLLLLIKLNNIDNCNIPYFVYNTCKFYNKPKYKYLYIHQIILKYTSSHKIK